MKTRQIGTEPKTQPKRCAVTTLEVVEFIGEHQDKKSDPRLHVLYELAKVHDYYVGALSSIADTVQRAVDQEARYGVNISSSDLSSSRFDDARRYAVQIETLRRIIETTTKGKDNPEADEVDAFIRRHLDPSEPLLDEPNFAPADEIHP